MNRAPVHSWIVHARGWQVAVDVALGSSRIRIGLCLSPVGRVLDHLACLGHHLCLCLIVEHPGCAELIAEDRQRIAVLA